MRARPERQLYLDFIRAAATIAVILIHVTAQNFHIDPHETTWDVFNIINSGVHWAVPAFLMISGAVFLEKNITIKEIFGKYIFRIAVAYVFWSAVYAVLYIVRHSGAGAKDFLREFIIGHFHMWFLPVIAGIYLVIPLLKPISEERSTEKWFIILGFIFGIVLPQLSSLAPFLIPEEYRDFIIKLIDKPKVMLVQGYSFYFLLGHYLSKIKEPLLPGKRRIYTAGLWLAGISGWAATALLTKYLSIKSGKATSIAYGELTINVLLESIFVFCIFKSLFHDRNQDKTVPRLLESVVNFLSKYSFGVYLVHPLFLKRIRDVMGIDTLSFKNPVIGVFVIFAAVYVLSYIASIIIRHVPLIGKYVA